MIYDIAVAVATLVVAIASLSDEKRKNLIAFLSLFTKKH